jgi:hypothetical protein
MIAILPPDGCRSSAGLHYRAQVLETHSCRSPDNLTAALLIFFLVRQLSWHELPEYLILSQYGL